MLPLPLWSNCGLPEIGMQKSQSSLAAHGDIKGIFDCSEPEQVFALVNGFLQDLARTGSAGEIPVNLLPPSIRSLAELERWLIPVRIEAQRQQGHSASKNTALITLSRMLAAANRQIRTLIRRRDPIA
jgi:hypothetical protein